MQAIDIGKGHVGDLQVLERRPDVDVDRAAIVPLRRGAFAGQIFLDEPIAKVGNGLGVAIRLDLRKRVLAAFNSLLELDRLAPRGLGTPLFARSRW